MIGIDTNVLIAAHRSDAAHHATCLGFLEALVESGRAYAVFWPSLYEFMRVVTHHKVFQPPTSQHDALEAISDFLAPAQARVLSETSEHPAILKNVLATTPASGNLMHDAHLVTLAVEHGVHKIITYDQDFKRFSQVASEPPTI